MITVQNMATADEQRRLNDLAARWPVGLKVRHSAGWTGEVVPDDPHNVHGLGLDVAHCLAGDAAVGAVCVTWTTVDGVPATAWHRPHVLTPVGKPKPQPERERKRTWRTS